MKIWRMKKVGDVEGIKKESREIKKTEAHAITNRKGTPVNKVRISKKDTKKIISGEVSNTRIDRDYWKFEKDVLENCAKEAKIRKVPIKSAHTNNPEDIIGEVQNTNVSNDGRFVWYGLIDDKSNTGNRIFTDIQNGREYGCSFEGLAKELGTEKEDGQEIKVIKDASIDAIVVAPIEECANPYTWANAIEKGLKDKQETAIIAKTDETPKPIEKQIPVAGLPLIRKKKVPMAEKLQKLM